MATITRRNVAPSDGRSYMAPRLQVGAAGLAQIGRQPERATAGDVGAAELAPPGVQLAQAELGLAAIRVGRERLAVAAVSLVLATQLQQRMRVVRVAGDAAETVGGGPQQGLRLVEPAAARQ